MEQALRLYREEALKVLQENRHQSREAVEMLVKQRLQKLTAAAAPGRALDNDQLQAFFAEVLDLSFSIFSLGFTMAQAENQRR